MTRTAQLDRRSLLLSASALAVAGVAATLPKLARATAMAPAKIAIENFSPAGKDLGPVTVAKVVKSEADWKKMLKPQQFEVTRHADTEQSFTGIY